MGAPICNMRAVCLLDVRADNVRTLIAAISFL